MHRYFSEVDSLRALAVIAVVLNHIDKSILPGGYIGVDVFFVLSGFVVTSSLVNSETANFNNFIRNFYKKRFKRLYPALLCCLALTFLFTFTFYSSPYPVLSTGFWSIFGLSNIELILSAQDYFAVNAEANPFTHTWSLGVEEQFYFVFPVLFFLIFKKSVVGFRNFLIMLVVGSLALFLYFEKNNINLAFYLMPTRFWQLGLGSLTFLTSFSYLGKRLSRHLIIVPLLALVFILYTGAEFSSSYAVCASLLTCVALLFIKETHQRNYLLFPPITKIGLYSYSIYLYHWPFLVFFKQTISIERYNLFLASLGIALFSFLSYNYVEKKLRTAKWSRIQTTPVVIIIGLLFFSHLYPKKIKKYLFIGRPAEQFSSWNDIPPEYRKKCFLHTNKTRAPFENPKVFPDYLFKTCKIHQAKSGKRIISFGNSYLEEKIPVLLKIAKNKDYDLYTYIMSGVVVYPYKVEWKKFEDKRDFFWRAFFVEVEHHLKTGDIVFVSTPIQNFIDKDGFFTNEKGENISSATAFDIFTKTLVDLTVKYRKKGAHLVLTTSYPILKPQTLPSNCYQPWSKYNPKCELEYALDRNISAKILHLDTQLNSNPNLNYISIYKEVEAATRNIEEPIRLFHNFNHISKLTNDFIYPKIIKSISKY